MKTSALIAVILMLVGCVPGEAEFTIPTSRMRAALQGKPSHIQVRTKVEIPLSNAYDRVSIGTCSNRLDFIRTLLCKDSGKLEINPMKIGDTNDYAGVSIVTSSNAVPVFRLESSLRVLIIRPEVLRDFGRIEDLAILAIGDDGCLLGSGFNEERALNVPRWLFWAGNLNMLTRLMDKSLLGHDEDEAALFSVCSVHKPEFCQRLSCVIVGDSDAPLYVSAKNVMVDGVFQEGLSRAVRKGERVHLAFKDKCDAEKTVFSLKSPEETFVGKK